MTMLGTNICIYVLKEHPLSVLEKLEVQNALHLLIAAHAKSPGVTLATHHVHGFSRTEGLIAENRVSLIKEKSTCLILHLSNVGLCA